MAEFITGRLDPTSRLTLEHPQEQRDQGSARRRNAKPEPKKSEPEEAPEEPKHELDQMA